MASRLLLVVGVCFAVGCGGDDEKVDNGPPPPASDPNVLDVTGSVVSTYGYALPGVAVKVWSANAGAPVELSTNATGTFTAGTITRPYDVSVVEPGTGAIYVFVGVESATPSLVLTHYSESTARAPFGMNASVFDAPANATTQGMFETAFGAVTGNIDASQSGYGFSAYGPSDAASVVGTYRALQWQVTASRLSNYVGYDEQQVTASPTTPTVSTVITPFAARRLTVRGRLASGASARFGQLVWRTAAPAVVDAENFDNGVVSFLVSSDSRIPMAIEVYGFSTSVVFRTIDTSVATIDVTAPDPIAWTSPVEGAAFDDTSVFTVTSVEGAAYEVGFVGTGGATYVIGTSPTFSAALLRNRGASLLPGSYQANGAAFLGAGDPISAERLSLAGRYAHDGSVSRRTEALTVTVP